ncbi:hypothetical protein MUK42_09133 [Musa troglodytarum]|uniref:Uncharacterized protein n=1 Tax=Musa troglodytarum TaxID=320322 RepID=A0A9E7FZC7_9LILI|nr:hypothetical protein MUK42_09133 [Musa troglodytarum]
MDIHELFIGNNTPSPLLAALALSSPCGSDIPEVFAAATTLPAAPVSQSVPEDLPTVLDGEEVREDLGAEDSKEEDPRVEASVVTNGERDEHKASYLRSNGVGFRKDGISRTRMTDFDMALPEPTPSESKLIQDANLVNRN